MSTESFFLVWTPGGSSPTYRHPNKSSALKEAERLAKCNKGLRFYVLEAISESVSRDVQTITLVPPELPF